MESIQHWKLAIAWSRLSDHQSASILTCQLASFFSSVSSTQSRRTRLAENSERSERTVRRVRSFFSLSSCHALPAVQPLTLFPQFLIFQSSAVSPRSRVPSHQRRSKRFILRDFSYQSGQGVLTGTYFEAASLSRSTQCGFPSSYYIPLSLYAIRVRLRIEIFDIHSFTCPLCWFRACIVRHVYSSPLLAYLDISRENFFPLCLLLSLVAMHFIFFAYNRSTYLVASGSQCIVLRLSCTALLLLIFLVYSLAVWPSLSTQLRSLTTGMFLCLSLYHNI